jgi:peroxiredoxin Q/BCP
LADYAKVYPEFRAAGAEVVAISVDPPDRSAGMSKDLSIPFSLLSDSDRATIIEWGVLNAKEKGGIAIPSTFLIDRARKVRLASVEDMMMRIEPGAMLEVVRTLPSGSAPVPRARSVNPAMMFLRAMANGFRHGVNVKNPTQ